ncbi:hypothetical protein AAVH_17057 [Aphelenchoides avenae]|nr:hypothetical protein AAVH_17057 [Aphelenchus avenae]
MGADCKALTPLFVAVFPILACVICITFSLDWLGRLVELATSVLSWIPIMNPTFTIIFVKSYRDFVFGPFVKKWRSFVTPAPSAARAVATDTVLPGGLSLATYETD